METMRDIIWQETNEQNFSRKLIDRDIKQFIIDNYQEKIEQGISLVQDYLSGSYYDSKAKRIDQLKTLDIQEVVLGIFIGASYCTKEELFTSVTAQMAGRLGFSDRADSIKTVAELMAILCNTDVFDIIKANKMASLMVISRMPFPDSLVFRIENSGYLPPMVCEPLDLENNYSSGYLSFNDSVMLGTGNHHGGDLCLDVLNTMNKVALKLDTAYLSTYEEEPTFELDTQEKVEQWNAFKKQSYKVYTLLAQQNNRFYLTHKVDKRGRIYSQGYHVNTQGAPFKKAMVELANEELIEGMP